MKPTAILFDLDGTLLPMDQEVFTKAYFQELAKVLAPLGMNPDVLVPAVWDGTKAMVMNDGQRPNRDVFWSRFAHILHEDVERYRPTCDRFYSEEFHLARRATEANPLAKEAVQAAHAKAEKVILATNPLFPLAGQITRLSWLGLRPEDFDLITSYESDSYCKPNPLYYRSICERMNLSPADCLMIGNDEREDMHSASSLGMSAYLVTDCRIACADHPWHGPQGSFADMVRMLKNL